LWQPYCFFCFFCLFCQLPQHVRRRSRMIAGEITGEAPAVGDDAETSAEETTVDPASLLTLENRDFNGADFTIVYINWALYNGYIISEEESGDTVNDAVYPPNLAL
jgi:hypothetical protein